MLVSIFQFKSPETHIVWNSLGRNNINNNKASTLSCYCCSSVPSLFLFVWRLLHLNILQFVVNQDDFCAVHGTRPGQLVMVVADGRGLVEWREDLSVLRRWESVKL